MQYPIHARKRCNFSQSKSLRRACLGTRTRQRRSQVAGKAHGATFELTKLEEVVFEKVGDISSLLLTLKGKVKGKEILRSDFVNALGKQELEWPARRFRSSQMLIWDATKVTRPQSK